MAEFQAFKKLSRLSRPVVITEKIDGTNAQVFIPEADEAHKYARKVMAGSRNRWLEPGNDNFGFAAWVEKNFEELLRLGPGRHYGEWWGRGIQRGYSLPEKKFSLFNTVRWSDPETRPKCCDVVPVLAEIPSLDIYAAKKVMSDLMKQGSKAAPGFTEPEGIVMFHTHSGLLFKMTPDDEAKGGKNG